MIEAYDYDTTGKNRLDQVTFSDASPQVDFGYDTNGNTTTYGDRTLIYNENNRLVEVKEGESTIATYTYNGLGQRLKKTAGGVTTYYIYDQNGQLIAETTSGATTEYLYMGKIRMAMVDVTTGDFYFYLNDRLGTPQLMTYGNSTTVMWEARYKPFGEAMVHPQSEVVNNFRFPGQYFDDETGFHYNYHRYYDPGTGRYLRADPIGLESGINLFAYAENDPINSFDPLGLDAQNAVTFVKLWNSHPTILGEENPCMTKGKSNFPNQCAIRLGTALARVGVNTAQLPGVTHCWYHDKKAGHTIRAEELARGLSRVSIPGIGGTQRIDPKIFSKILSGKTGIIFFRDYWSRVNECETTGSGDHIDLWNKSRLTDWTTWLRINLNIGRFGPHSLFPSGNEQFSGLRKKASFAKPFFPSKTGVSSIF